MFQRRFFYLLSRSIGLCCLVSFLLTGCAPDLPEEIEQAYEQLPDKVDYNLHVKPILSDKCFACHGPDQAKREAGLRLDLPTAAYAELPETPGKVAIDPGSLTNSELFHRILSEDHDYRMPTPESNLQLSTEEKAILIKWIKQGAEYQPHWSFVTPTKPAVPTVKQKEWVQTPVDAFILKKLEEKKLAPADKASKELLLRRLSLDLTGLPPTEEEIRAFVNDNSPKAVEKQVDRLLQSPQFGEKMAVDWLDLARFADSHGYTVDGLRDVSAYRDWVIAAFNRNMPYNQFIEWQLAGDLLPNPTKEMKIATAFNRMHPQNLEGGVIEEEFQTEYVVDRVNTVGTAFLGLTISCARCHDHKYDPVSQQNFYELYSFFNTVQEAGQISFDLTMPSPSMLLTDDEKDNVLALLNQKIKEQEKKLLTNQKAYTKQAQQWIDQEKYKSMQQVSLPVTGLQTSLNFDGGHLRSGGGTSNITAAMKRDLSYSAGDPPKFVASPGGKALLLNGDEWLDLTPVGAFKRNDPFTISINCWIPKDFQEGVIFHKTIAERLFNYRGYHLYYKNDQLEMGISHAAPSNALTKVSKQPIPKEEWIQLTMTYDGSATAAGMHLYLNGKLMQMEITMDQLTKDILPPWNAKLGLQVGAWDRGLGFKNGKVEEVLVYDRALSSLELLQLSNATEWKSLFSKPASSLTASERTLLQDYYLATQVQTLKQDAALLKAARQELTDTLTRIPELMIMQESKQPKKSYILDRGQYDAKTTEVFPNTPEAIFPYNSKLPKNRLGLANWLTDPKHPLTARVAVNRYWQLFFGKGLVKTTEDFGNQGSLPTHPELLDWLAVSFVESGWDLKQLIRQLVLSATYAQSSVGSEKSRQLDPENLYLSHATPTRLTAEMLRDNALAASGLLERSIGGKSIKPYQPAGLWEINNTSYQADTGTAVYRRSLYVLIKRSVPNPTLATFDAGDRSYCVVRRQATNTPLQALVTLNDPVFVESCKVMGEQMVRMGGTDKAIETIFLRLTGRRPDQKEKEILLKAKAKQLALFKKEPGKLKGWLEAGQYKVDASLPKEEIAANAVVASLILNSDATITKR
ncbi:DUF1553 domain-containing protein [Flavihumibacter sp. RY-1]|uniref:DUF1553 domain-containing protein n=1 Tax=Flavihumibacter fluminis TaxID=2909236 RepID=A0ABS9BIX4_9BACT|nr:DUF1553 domain-containing protein [Flavihumibacter fluminis]MCF1715677.1 DUF1553 domain-containing protein [Flavihumibacter fluminis]